MVRQTDTIVQPRNLMMSTRPYTKHAQPLALTINLPPSTVKSASFMYMPPRLLSMMSGATISSGLPGRSTVSLIIQARAYTSHG